MAASNGKDIETKAEQSFDLDFVFDIEAKQTCCTASHKTFFLSKEAFSAERRKEKEERERGLHTCGVGYNDFNNLVMQTL